MELNDHSLRQMDEDDIRNLPEAALRDLAVRLLMDLKAARERLNQNSQNSSRPPGSDVPWVKIAVEDAVDEDSEWGDDVGVSVDCEDADETGTERPDVDDPREDTSGEADHQTVQRKPGKQPGAPGFGRQQRLPVTADVDHRATSCDRCGKDLEEAVLSSRAYTGFYTLDIQWGNPEAPGLVVTNTLHLYYETPCHCGHLTREAPGSQPPDALLPGVALSEWRLVGRCLFGTCRFFFKPCKGILRGFSNNIQLHQFVLEIMV